MLATAALVVLFACKRETTSSAPATTGSAASSTPAGAGSTAGSPEALLAAMLDYSDQMVPIVIGFAGDCDATAKRMVALEPLARTIRTQGEAIEANPTARDAFRERMRGAKDGALARIDAQLKAVGATREDMDRKEAEIKKTCAGNPAYLDAVQRVGLKKKRS
jgi:hypothetical protein